MLLRNSIANTRKFFKKTLGTLKTFFSASYQRLPKTPPPFSAGVDMEIDSTFYVDFKKKDKAMVVEPSSMGQEKEVRSGGFVNNIGNAVNFSTTMQDCQIERVEKKIQRTMDICATHQRKMQKNNSSSKCLRSDRKRICLVAQKLKELEKLADTSNVDHALDIEEVLHYYSRLTCPAYLEIVDRFFVEIFAEFSANSSSPPCSIKSRLRPKPVGLMQRKSILGKKESPSDFF